MSNSQSAASPERFDGSMFLYDKPVLLSKEAHGNMGLSRSDQPFAFVRDVKGLPVVVDELQTAQKHYPIVFSDFESPVLIAVVGIIDDQNLFVNDAGEWAADHYIPSYARCHPFAFARREGDEYAIVIDESSKSISSSPETPFFDGDDLSESVQQRVDFCGQLNEARQRTLKFGERIKELGLLNGQRVAQTLDDGSEVKIADYVSIDPSKLQELDKDTLQELHKDGSLSVIFAQIFSLENWNRLIARRKQQLEIS